MNEEPSAPPETAPPPSSQLWRMVLAGASFVLGLLSCISCILGFIPGVLAILLGIGAHAKQPRTKGHVPGTGTAKLGIAFGLIGIALAVWFIFALKGSHGHHMTPDEACRNHFSTIRMALIFYAEDHDGALPDKLSTLADRYVRRDVFLCPKSRKKSGDLAHIDEWSDYVLIPGLRETETPADRDVLVFFEKEYNHTPRGRNELYLDGHFEFHELGKPHQSSKPTQP